MIKPVKWQGDSLTRVRAFPVRVREAAGGELRRVQQGLEPTDWKPMTSVGLGVKEIRLHVEGEHRVLYAAKFAGAIYVLHAFQKTSQKTAKGDIDLAARRYRQLAGELLKAKWQ